MKLGLSLTAECQSCYARASHKTSEAIEEKAAFGGLWSRFDSAKYWPATRTRGRDSSCYETIMETVTLKLSVPHRIAPERFAEALDTADARAGLRSFQEGMILPLRSFFSVPDEQFGGSDCAAQNGRKTRSQKYCGDLPQLNSPLLMRCASQEAAEGGLLFEGDLFRTAFPRRGELHSASSFRAQLSAFVRARKISMSTLSPTAW